MRAHEQALVRVAELDRIVLVAIVRAVAAAARRHRFQIHLTSQLRQLQLFLRLFILLLVLEDFGLFLFLGRMLWRLQILD